MKKTIIDAINDWADSAEQTAKKARTVAKVLTAIGEQTAGIPADQALTVEAKEESEEKKTGKKDAKSDASVEEITVGMIRTVLAEKSQAGLTAKVKELLNSYGAEKLSAIKPEDYSAVYAAAKELS